MARIVLNIPGSDTEDHQPIIQKALDAVESDEGGVVYIPDGLHMIGPGDDILAPDDELSKYSLRLGHNVHLQLGNNTILRRRFQRGGAASATICNKYQLGPGAPTKNVKVSGGTIDRSTGGNNFGKHLGFQAVNGLTVEGVRFNGVWKDWNAEFRNCNDVRVTGVVMNSGVDTLEDGLHFSGGSRIVVSDCNIICGDDALAFVNNSGTDPLLDIVVTNCYLHSQKASALKILTEATATTPIRRVQISNIVAKSSGFILPPPPPPATQLGRGIIIEDESTSSTPMVSDIEISGVWLDASVSGGFPLTINNAERVRLNRVVVWKPHSRCVINKAADVELCDCVVDTPDPMVAGTQCLWVGETGPCSNIRLIGGMYRGATSWGVIVGSQNHAVTGFEVVHARITNSSAGAGGSGLLIANASGGLVIGNRITENSGWGIEEVIPSNDNIFISNRLISNTSGPIAVSGGRSEAIRNVSEQTVEVKDTGGFRQTIDGWTWTITQTNENPTEMSRANGRFRAVRAGSVTGIVITTSASRMSGSITAEVYKNTGLAGDPGATIDHSVFINNLTHPSRNAVTIRMNATPATQFLPGQELYIVVYSNSWGPIPATILCALEVED